VKRYEVVVCCGSGGTAICTRLEVVMPTQAEEEMHERPMMDVGT
jgi:hypothetical protein